MHLKLTELSPFYDEVFKNFFNRLLKREHLSGFFKSKGQIRGVVKKQRKNIEDSLGESNEAMRKRYIWLAEMHVAMGVSLVDYIEAFNFLRDEFFSILMREKRLIEFYREVNDYYEKARQYSSEGYLNGLVRELVDLIKTDIIKDFKPIEIHNEHISRGLSALTHKDTLPLKETGINHCPIDSWLTGIEAKMLLPETETHNRIESLHKKLHSLCQSVSYYVLKGLCLQAYWELKSLMHASSFFHKELAQVYNLSATNREKVFFEFLRKGVEIEKDFLLYAKVKNPSELTGIYDKGFGESQQTDVVEAMESKLEGCEHVVIPVHNGAVGLLREKEQDKGTIENIKKSLPESLKLTAINLKELCRGNTTILEHLNPVTWKRIVDAEDATEAINAEAKKHKYIELLFEEDRLDVFFQPACGLRTGKLYDLEALVRLREDKGYVQANLFIDAIYERNLITELDMRVLEKVVSYASRLKDITNKVFINVSPLSFKIPAYRESVEKAIRLLKDKDISPYFEITEQALLDYTELAKYLKSNYGIGFVVDDFGTGYSSLKTVADLAEAEVISHLKIDGSLTKRILYSEETYKVVRSIASMAKSLGIKTVAEFVEDAETVKRLIELDIDYGQGFYYSPASHIEKLSLR